MQSYLKTLILTLHLLLHTSPAESYRKASDCHILLEFKSSVGDPSRMLSSWIPSSNHCSWSGVSCDSSSRVSSLRLAGGRCPTLHHSPRSPPPAPPRALLRRRRCDRTRGWLNGTLPASLGGLHHLRVISLPFHRLRGEIPYAILSLQNLKVLDLEGNIFSCGLGLKSPISDSVLLPPCGLNLSPLFLSSASIITPFTNDRRNSIPDTRRALGSLVLGEVPFSDHNQSSFLQSLETMPSPPEAVKQPGALRGRGLSSIQLASIISASAIASVLLALLLMFLYIRKWVPLSKIQVMELREITLFSNPGVHLTFDTIVNATSHFSAGKCIGSGGFGATYKAEVSPGVLLAVKRVSVGRFVQGVQQFHAEIKTLGRIRHPNLVTLIGYHAGNSEMFLIYNYLPGGNLERFIQERREGGPVEWTVVHRVASQIAAALAYLHDDCVPRVLHRDVKPSNILLDGRLNAYLSDFGLSRLMGASETHATTGVAGTFGYVAPEYAMTCRVSEKSDVYSYGVVLLELISDKKALDPSFSDHGNGFNIVSWACMMMRQGRAGEVFTKRLWEDGPQSRLVALLHLAVMCTVDSLAIRPTMSQVVQRLTQLG